jgi:hypothetical protein
MYEAIYERSLGQEYQNEDLCSHQRAKLTKFRETYKTLQHHVSEIPDTSPTKKALEVLDQQFSAYLQDVNIGMKSFLEEKEGQG